MIRGRRKRRIDSSPVDMSMESVDPVIARSFARDTSIEDLNQQIADVRLGVLTGAVTSLNILGVNTAINPDRLDLTLKTLEAARQIKLEEEDMTGTATAIALDALSPLGHGLDFSRRRIE